VRGTSRDRTGASLIPSLIHPRTPAAIGAHRTSLSRHVDHHGPRCTVILNSLPACRKSRLRRRCRAPAKVPKFRHRSRNNRGYGLSLSGGFSAGLQLQVIMWRVSSQTGLRVLRPRSQSPASVATACCIHCRIASRWPDGTAHTVSTGCGSADRGDQRSQKALRARGACQLAGRPFQVTCPTPGKILGISDGLMGCDHPRGSLRRLRATEGC
jgi:hypothetical protein